MASLGFEVFVPRFCSDLNFPLSLATLGAKDLKKPLGAANQSRASLKRNIPGLHIVSIIFSHVDHFLSGRDDHLQELIRIFTQEM